MKMDGRIVPVMSRGTPRSQHKQRLWEELKREKERIAKIKAELEKMEDIKFDDKSTIHQSKVSSRASSQYER